MLAAAAGEGANFRFLFPAILLVTDTVVVFEAGECEF